MSNGETDPSVHNNDSFTFNIEGSRTGFRFKLPAGDPDGDTFTYESADLPAFLQILPTGELAYVDGSTIPLGTVSFTVKVQNDAGEDSAAVTVTRESVPIVALSGDTHGVEFSSANSTTGGDLIHIQFFRSNRAENAAPDTSPPITVKFQLQWGTVNRGDFEPYTSASILDQLEGLTTGGVGQITIPAGASYAELVLKPDAELVIERDSGTFTVTLVPDSAYEIATQKRAIHGTKRLYEYDSLTYTIYDGAVLYVQGVDDPTPIYFNDADQGRVLDCYLMAALAGATMIDPSIIMNAITDNGNYTYTVRLTIPIGINGQPFVVTLRLDEILDRGECMAQPADVSPSGAVEIWPVVLEHAIDKMMGQYGYVGGFPGNSSGTLNSITNTEASNQVSMPVKEDEQTVDGYFDAFLDVLVPNQSGVGKQLILNSKQKKKINGEIVDGTINGDGDRTVTAAHAYLVLSYDTMARTITCYDPRGSLVTFTAKYLRDFESYDVLSQ